MSTHCVLGRKQRVHNGRKYRPGAHAVSQHWLKSNRSPLILRLWESGEFIQNKFGTRVQTMWEKVGAWPVYLIPFPALIEATPT